MALVELANYPNAMEAAMVRGLLDAEGIDSVAFDGGMNIADSAGWVIPVRVKASRWANGSVVRRRLAPCERVARIGSPRPLRTGYGHGRCRG